MFELALSLFCFVQFLLCWEIKNLWKGDSVVAYGKIVSAQDISYVGFSNDFLMRKRDGTVALATWCKAVSFKFGRSLLEIVNYVIFLIFWITRKFIYMSLVHFFK